LWVTTFGFFFLMIFFGVKAFTFTGAVSVAVTFGPDGGVPVAVATLSNAVCTDGLEQLYVTAAPGTIDANPGICAFVRLHAGDNGSATVTSVRTVFPVFVTVMLNFAVPPIATV
jgi:hypothetical protein